MDGDKCVMYVGHAFPKRELRRICEKMRVCGKCSDQERKDAVVAAPNIAVFVHIVVHLAPRKVSPYIPHMVNRTRHLL